MNNEKLFFIIKYRENGDLSSLNEIEYYGTEKQVMAIAGYHCHDKCNLIDSIKRYTSEEVFAKFGVAEIDAINNSICAESRFEKLKDLGKGLGYDLESILKRGISNLEFQKELIKRTEEAIKPALEAFQYI